MADDIAHWLLDTHNAALCVRGLRWDRDSLPVSSGAADKAGMDDNLHCDRPLIRDRILTGCEGYETMDHQFTHPSGGMVSMDIEATRRDGRFGASDAQRRQRIRGGNAG
jgi:hypothetical protein